MFDIAVTNRFKKDVRKCSKSFVFPYEELETALMCLKNNKPLPVNFRDHELSGKFKGIREFHLLFDMLVLYQVNKAEKVIYLLRLGPHSEVL